MIQNNGKKDDAVDKRKTKDAISLNDCICTGTNFLRSMEQWMRKEIKNPCIVSPESAFYTTESWIVHYSKLLFKTKLRFTKQLVEE